MVIDFEVYMIKTFSVASPDAHSAVLLYLNRISGYKCIVTVWSKLSLPEWCPNSMMLACCLWMAILSIPAYFLLCDIFDSNHCVHLQVLSQVWSSNTSRDVYCSHSNQRENLMILEFHLDGASCSYIESKDLVDWWWTAEALWRCLCEKALAEENGEEVPLNLLDAH